MILKKILMHILGFKYCDRCKAFHKIKLWDENKIYKKASEDLKNYIDDSIMKDIINKNKLKENI